MDSYRQFTCIVRVVVLVGALLPPTALAARRAFVVGNDDYRNLPALSSAAGDSSNVRDALQADQFEVTHLVNLTHQEVIQSWKTFAANIAAGDDVFVYYAGHGVQSGGVNFLLPIDFPKEGVLSRQAVRADTFVEAAGKARLRMIILDACRDNPLSSARPGLAEMKVGPGTYLMFATQPGAVAKDGLFASHFVKQLREPGLSLHDVVNSTSTLVTKEYSAQTPYASFSAVPDFRFVPDARPISNISFLDLGSHTFAAHLVPTDENIARVRAFARAEGFVAHTTESGDNIFQFYRRQVSERLKESYFDLGYLLAVAVHQSRGMALVNNPKDKEGIETYYQSIVKPGIQINSSKIGLSATELGLPDTYIRSQNGLTSNLAFDTFMERIRSKVAGQSTAGNTHVVAFELGFRVYGMHIMNGPEYHEAMRAFARENGLRPHTNETGSTLQEFYGRQLAPQDVDVHTVGYVLAQGQWAAGAVAALKTQNQPAQAANLENSYRATVRPLIQLYISRAKLDVASSEIPDSVVNAPAGSDANISFGLFVERVRSAVRSHRR